LAGVAREPPGAHGPARMAEGVAIANPAPHRKRADPMKEVADEGDLEQLRLGEEVERPRAETADEGVVDPREVVGDHDSPALERHALEAVAGYPSDGQGDRDHRPARERPDALGLLAQELRDAELGERLPHFSRSRRRCSSWAMRSSSSSTSPRVTSPSSRKSPARPLPVRSPSRTVSLRQRPLSSSITERASSRPIAPRADSSPPSASPRSALRPTAPTPARA